MGKGKRRELELGSRLLKELQGHKSLLTQSQRENVILRDSQKSQSQGWDGGGWKGRDGGEWVRRPRMIPSKMQSLSPKS